MMTREGARTAYGLSSRQGIFLEMGPWGRPEGTTIIVRDLFYNTPARLKFMKSDKVEGSNRGFRRSVLCPGRPEAPCAA